MTTILLTKRHADQIAGVLSCYDRILVFGTLPGVCFAEGMTSYLYAHKVRIFDYAQFAKPSRERLQENAERLAKENGIEIQFLRKRNVRKEDLVEAMLARRGRHAGLLAIFSAMEPCSTYQPWHNKQTGQTYLRADDGKCLHYYFYFIDEELGLTYKLNKISSAVEGLGWVLHSVAIAAMPATMLITLAKTLSHDSFILASPSPK